MPHALVAIAKQYKTILANSPELKRDTAFMTGIVCLLLDTILDSGAP
jgi:hypothetical protein